MYMYQYFGRVVINNMHFFYFNILLHTIHTVIDIANINILHKIKGKYNTYNVTIIATLCFSSLFKYVLEIVNISK